MWARRTNKRLLERAKETPTSKYDPPTPEEIQSFVSDMAARGLAFNSQCEGYKHPRSSREVIFKD